ncbi:MAG: hypothetical protein IKP73_12230 [Bacteroidales bacterium]|nr:hypothetical protein [Bacteroidales bacterium]
MALNKEIWASDIQQMLLPDNSFVTKGTDYSVFADNSEIHIPVEYGSVNTEIDRNVLPGTVTQQSDTERVIVMHHYTTDPVSVFNPEDVELSYDKRQVITRKIADSLNAKIAQTALATLAQFGSKTGSKVLTVLRDIAKDFDKGDYPEQDRYVLLSADSYSALLKELTDAQTNSFLAVANAQNGIIGQIFGLNILKRSTLGDASAVAIAWHKRDYMYALAPVQTFASEGDPTFYGAVLSASARFGCYVPEPASDEPANGD